jgi:hypothetical protein
MQWDEQGQAGDSRGTRKTRILVMMIQAIVMDRTVRKAS